MSKEEFIARIRYLGWICFQMEQIYPCMMCQKITK